MAQVEAFELAVFEKRHGLRVLAHLSGWRRTPCRPCAADSQCDPAPRDALVLELMSRDPRLSLSGQTVLFQADAPPCHSDCGRRPLRPKGVASSAPRCSNLLLRRIGRYVIGFSGGGALAVLVANCASQCPCVTINGNLDTALWAGMRGSYPSGITQPVDVGLPGRVRRASGWRKRPVGPRSRPGSPSQCPADSSRCQISPMPAVGSTYGRNCCDMKARGLSVAN